MPAMSLFILSKPVLFTMSEVEWSRVEGVEVVEWFVLPVLSTVEGSLAEGVWHRGGGGEINTKCYILNAIGYILLADYESNC